MIGLVLGLRARAALVYPGELVGRAPVHIINLFEMYITLGVNRYLILPYYQILEIGTVQYCLNMGVQVEGGRCNSQHSHT